MPKTKPVKKPVVRSVGCHTLTVQCTANQLKALEAFLRTRKIPFSGKDCPCEFCQDV